MAGRRKSKKIRFPMIANILAKVPKREQPTALLILRQIPYAESRQEAERLQAGFPGVVPKQRRIQWSPRSPGFGCEPMRPSASRR